MSRTLIGAGALKERSRYAGQGERRLPKGLLTGLDAICDDTELAKLQSVALRLLGDKMAFQHRQMRRKEGVMRRLEVQQ